MTGGTGTPLSGTAAKSIDGLSSIRAVLATIPFFLGQSNHSLAISTTGAVSGWGANGSDGALGLPRGNGSVVVNTPVALSSLGSAVQVQACGYLFSIALHADGTVWLLPSGSDINRTAVTARQIDGLANISSLGRSGEPEFGEACSMLAVDTMGVLRMINLVATTSSGGDTTTSSISVIGNLPAIIQAQCSDDFYSRHCLALTAGGQVWAWGQNIYGQLGDGTTTGRTVPVKVIGLETAVQVAVLNDGSLARLADGTVWSWGSSLAKGRLQPVPEDGYLATPISGLTGVSWLAVGYDHACALESDGTVWCWGQNDFGQLGLGTFTPAPVPEQALGIQLN